jgi:uncharacterized membrane protein
MNTGKRQRFQPVDILRGLAIAMMVAYHFSYDLDYFGLASFDFYEGRFWRSARTFILGMFLLLVGVSLVIATRNGINRHAFLRRLAVLVLCAVLISVATYFVFAERMILFGVLHFIALASILGLLFIRLFWLNAVLGVAAILSGVYYSNPVFDQPLLQWVGLMTFRPGTEDYVPLLPWFGVVLLGIFLGRLLFASQVLSTALNWQGRRFPARLLALAGRHSLLIYMLHQPVLLGILWLATR